MKNFTTNLITLLLAFAFSFANAQTYNVTFRVDMKNVDPTTFTTPEVNGTFNGWCGNCNAMSDADGDNIWDIVIPLADGTYEFKYAADAWTIQENLTPGDPCVLTTGPNTNRTLVVAGGDVDLGTVCWESCDECPNDLVLQGVIDFTVPAGGSSGKATHVRATADIADLSIYGLGTANNGGGTDGQEYTFDAISVLAGEDILVVRDLAEMTSYFGSCFSEYEHVLVASGAGVDQNGDDAIELFENGNVIETYGDVSVDGTGQVWEYLDAWAYKDAAGTVTFGGENWTVAAINCTDGSTTIYDASCIYPICPLNQIDLPISWDDALTDYTVSDFGGNSSSLIVDPAGLRGNILQSDKTSGAQTWAGTTLGTATGFANPIPFVSGATTMTAHVYSPSIGAAIRLKAEDASDPTKSVETQVTSTVANDWEVIVFDFANEVTGTAQIDFTYTYDKLSIFYDFGNTGAGDIYFLDEVLFGGSLTGTPGCTDPLASNYNSSATVDDGSCLYSVTFNVDMNCESAGSFTTPNLESPYYGWCGGCIALTDVDGDGVWSVTLDLPLGIFEYKYAVDSWAGQEDLVDDMIAGGACAPVTDYATYANRQITVTAGLTTADTYGSCDPCVLGCTDPTSLNYDPLATTDDGSCFVPMVDLFFSEYAEGSSNNKYFEIYNPTANTVDLSHYAYPNVSNAPTTPGVHEYWNTFAAGAEILPNDVYVVAHGSADASILAEADETFNYLSNGDDGFALVYGIETSYTIMDWLGDWDGDPGSGWDVAGVTGATQNHTLVRKCGVTTGNTSWTSSAGTDPTNSEWEVYPIDTWTYLGSHTSPCPISGCTDPTACNYDPLATTDDGSCILNTYTLTMVDSYGDGWNGNSFDVTDASGNLISSSTITSGALGTDVLCLPDACYDITCGGGSWAGEVSWTLTDDATGTVILSGGAPYGPTNICLPPVYGCTDPAYDNYDASATADDGSCTNSYTLNMVDSYGDGWNGNEWSATSTSTGTVYGPFTIISGSTGTATFTSTDLETLCHAVSCGGGSWGSEVSWDLQDASGTSILAGGAPYTGTLGTCILGCTDPNATNYDATADLDDGSCSYVACGAPAPTHETFSTGLLPVGVCTPNQWEISAVSGDGWRFTGNPGYNASTTSGNNRVSGEFAWIDFSGTDVDPILEVEHVDISTLTTPYVWFDYFSDLGTYTCASNNLLHVEAFDGSTWNLIVTMDLNVPGWNTYNYSLVGFENGSMAEVRFRAESSGLSCDYYNDLLLDDVRIMEAPSYGCTDPNYDNYDASANIDDGSCANNFTLYMYDSYGDGWNGNDWSATSTSTGAVYGPFTITSGSSGSATFTATELCFLVDCGGGSWASEVSWDLHDGSGTSILTGGAPYSGSFGTCTYGCTDPLSADYDATVDLDDGSCTYPCLDSDSTESFETNLGIWEQDAGDDFDWTWDAGGTPSSSTGPTTGLDGSYYLFTESSGNYGGVANLVVPCVDPTAWTSAAFVFGYHMYGATMGTLNVDVSDDNGATWTNIWTLSGDQGNAWSEAMVDLSSYTTQIDLRIQGVTGTSFTSDMAIDLTRFMEMPIPGCTNPNASNYNSSANIEDGSCAYTGCFPLTLTMNDSWGDGWNGNTFTITDSLGWTYLSTTLASGSTGTDSVCLPADVCYIVTCGGGSFPSEVSWTLTSDVTGGVVASGGAPYSAGLCGWPSGCMDPLASNYDTLALEDDGSCLYATTFNVNMNCEPAGSFTSVNLESPLFGWCGGCVPLTDPDGDGVWSVTLDLAAGPFEYKYAVDGWTGQEDLVDDMQNGGTCAPVTDYFSYANRLITVAAGYTTADTYGSCNDCVLGCMDALAGNYDPLATTDDGSCLYSATFDVDMTCVDPSTYSTVHLESPFFGCFTGCTQMTDPDGDNVYSVTVNLPLGANTYLYSVDYNSSQENLIDDMINGGTCAPLTDFFSYANREITVTTGSNAASDTYGSCDACIPGCTDSLANNFDPVAEFDDGSYCEYDVTFVVDMSCYVGTPTTVAATGPADNWSGNTYLLTDADGDNVWEGTYSVTNDFVYMYVVDTWVDSEFSGLFNEMLNGTNSCAPYTDNISYAYRLASSPSTTADVYGQCAPCALGCTDALASNYDASAQVDDGSCLYATTFNVDMNCEAVGSFTSVNLESPLFGWCGGCVPLTDADGDGVWSVTVDLALGNFEYKYAVDGWTGQEDLVDDMQNGASCAPITDYFSYANRLISVTPGTSTSDTYGSCDPCLVVYGCTDAGATNYNAGATDDDGSCLFSTTFNVDMNCEPAGSFGYVHLESPSFGWCGGCVPMTDPDGDGVHSVTVDLPAGNFEYKYAVDGWAGQEDLIDDMVGGASCAPVTDYFSYANRLLGVNEPQTVSGELVINGDFSLPGSWNYWYSQPGFTSWAVIDSALDLWFQGGTTDVVSNYDVFVPGKSYKVTLDATVNFGHAWFSDEWAGQDLLIDSTGSYEYIFTATGEHIRLSAIGPNPADLTIDNVSVMEIEYNNMPNTEDTYGSCSECILGCTDSLAFNYSDSAIVDDGSCLYGYNCSAPYPIGLSSSDIYAEMATIHWADANDGGSCRVWKYFVRYRPVGDSVWTTKSAGVGSGLCNVGLPNTSKVLRGLMPSTTYEFKMKAFYCGGGESGYSYADQFTTQDACPEMDTLMVETFNSNHAKARFTWAETGPYTFARVALRVNTPGSSWQTAGGFGVFYPTLSVNKFGLTSGTEYRAQGRTFCDVNVTSYRSDWTSPITWTQPGVAPIRLEGGSTINDLEVYPNPSKDIFNVSFVSEDVQNLEVRVLNMVGEVIYTEGLEQFVGEYTKSINMSKYTKGVYFLEITTNNGVVNKKIVLQ